MSEDFFNPAEDFNGPKVYVGAHVPIKLYSLLVEEAERAMATRSDVIRWALADRYRKQGASHSAALRRPSGGKMQEAGDKERGA